MELTKENGLFVLTGHNEVRAMGFKDMVKTMLKLGFDLDEVEKGIFALEVEGHSVACYGINRLFLFSK